MVRYQPFQKEILSAYEATAGTVGTAIWRDECRMADVNENQQTETESGYFGVAADVVDITEMQHHSETSATVPARTSGIAAQWMLGFIGNDTVTGAGDPYSHTGVPSGTSNLIKTFSLWLSRGDTSNVERMLKSTPTSIQFDSNPGGVATVAASFSGNYPVPVARPSPTVYIGSTANYKKTKVPGNAMVATIYNSAGAAYTCTIPRLSLSLSRPAGLIPNPNGKDPADIYSGILAVQGSFDFVYDGSASGTVHSDFLNHNALGDSGHVHTFVWTDADTHTWTFNMQGPFYLTGAPLTDGDQYISGSASFTAVNDMASANTASPVLTALKSVVITNALSSTLLA